MQGARPALERPARGIRGSLDADGVIWRSQCQRSLYVILDVGTGEDTERTGTYETGAST